jgi:hypothetical protein
MTSSKKDVAVTSLLLLINKCIAGGFNPSELSHIKEVSDALIEKPKSVEVRRSKLHTIWPESEKYLGCVTSGTLVVFMNSPHARYQKFIKNTLISFGVSRNRIRFIEVDTLDAKKKKEELARIINDHSSRAFLFMKDVSLELKGLIPPETSFVLSGPKYENLAHSVSELRKLLL